MASSRSQEGLGATDSSLRPSSFLLGSPQSRRLPGHSWREREPLKARAFCFGSDMLRFPRLLVRDAPARLLRLAPSHFAGASCRLSVRDREWQEVAWIIVLPPFELESASNPTPPLSLMRQTAADTRRISQVFARRSNVMSSPFLDQLSGSPQYGRFSGSSAIWIYIGPTR